MDLFFLMRSSRLNILAAELFSSVTEVQTVTGWSQLVLQPGVSRSDKPGGSFIFSCSGRWDGCCGAQHPDPGWAHRANVCPEPEAAQLSWWQLLQLTSGPQRREEAALGHLPLPCQRGPAEIIPVQTHQDTLKCCPLLLLMWSALKRVMGAFCFPAGSHQWLLLSSAPK